MAKRTGPTNPNLKRLIRLLRKISNEENVAIWDKVAEELERQTRRRREVNIEKLNRVTKPKDVVVIPGKFLATGEKKHDLTIAAWKCSETVKKKMKVISIEELIKQNPKGKNVKVIC